MRTLSISFVFMLLVLAGSCLVSCSHDPDPVNPQDTLVTGFGFMHRITGIWGGPVESGTMLGDFPDWQQDYRPVSSSQVSMKSELDKQNDIFMSFFIGSMNGRRYLFLRNGGHFASMQRVSYLVCDSANENTSFAYYRFADAKAGPNRVRSEVIFRNDSMIFSTHTNNTFHFRYDARRQDTAIADTVKHQLGYPQQVSVKDFTHAFDGHPDAVFYSFTGDPYPESEQPYMGRTRLQYSFDASITPDPNKNVLPIISARPLFSGLIFNPANLIYRTRYVILKSNETNYQFTYMHPGRYYINMLYDVNGDMMVNTGDYVSFPFDQSFQLAPQDSVTVQPVILLQVP